MGTLEWMLMRINWDYKLLLFKYTQYMRTEKDNYAH